MINLILTHASENIISTFNTVFLGIYFLKITNGNVASVVLFYLIKYGVTPLFSYLVNKKLNKQNVVNTYRIGIFLHALSFVFLLFMKEKIVDYIYLYAIITSCISQFYWQPYKAMIYNLKGDDEYKKFNAYNNIVKSLISILSAFGMGAIIVNLSYYYVFTLVFIISLIAFFVTFKLDIKDLVINQFENKNIIPLLKNKDAQKLYKMVFYEGMANCGALRTTFQLIVFLKFASEFTLGTWNALFALLGIITAIIVKNKLKKDKYTMSFIIAATSILISIIPMIVSSSFTYFVVYTVVYNIAIQITTILMNSAIFNVKELDILNEHKLEYTFLQESIHAIGKVVGEGLLLIVVLINPNLQNLQLVAGVLSLTILLQGFEYRKFIKDRKKIVRD